MPSNRITKTNIDRQTLKVVQSLALANGVSATKMLDIIIAYYTAQSTKVTHGNSL